MEQPHAARDESFASGAFGEYERANQQSLVDPPRHSGFPIELLVVSLLVFLCGQAPPIGAQRDGCLFRDFSEVERDIFDAQQAESGSLGEMRERIVVGDVGRADFNRSFPFLGAQASSGLDRDRDEPAARPKDPMTFSHHGELFRESTEYVRVGNSVERALTERKMTSVGTHRSGPGEPCCFQGFARDSDGEQREVATHEITS